MSSYLSSILTTTTSRYNSLRRTLLSDETDGDTEDDTHISRVLRAYYIEKGRPFPPWLPADPRAPQRPPPTQFTSTAGRGGGGGGGLSDLWDAPAQGISGQQQNPASLRRGGPVVAAPGRPGQIAAEGRLAADRHGSDGALADPHGARAGGGQLPYTAPRAGSYQSSLSAGRQSGSAASTGRSGGAYSPPPPPPSSASASSSGISAQERLKARLLGRSSSPTQSSSSLPSPGIGQSMPSSDPPAAFSDRNTYAVAPSRDQRYATPAGAAGGGGGGGSIMSPTYPPPSTGAGGGYDSRHYHSSPAAPAMSGVAAYPNASGPAAAGTGYSYSGRRWGSSSEEAGGGGGGGGSGSSGSAPPAAGNRSGGVPKRSGMGIY